MLPALRRLSHASRALWVALLLLAFVWHPVLLAASEVHEVQHLIQTGHDHHADEEGLGIPADEPAAPDDGDIWHGLMHLSHCCGHPHALPSDGVAALMLLGPACAPVAPTSAVRSLALPHPLRPPIPG